MTTAPQPPLRQTTPFTPDAGMIWRPNSKETV